MPLLKIRFENLALIVNRPGGATVLLPYDKHSAVLISTDNRPRKLKRGTNLQLLAPGGRPLSGSTIRASSEPIVHLDHVFRRKASIQSALLDGPLPANINLRIHLNGGALAGLSVSRYPILTNVRWTFRTRGRDVHSQRLTDTFEYSVEVPEGTYHLRASSAQAKDTLIPVTVAADGAQVSFRNDERCSKIQGPPLRLTEYANLYLLMTGRRADLPIPEGSATGYDWNSMPLHAAVNRLQATSKSPIKVVSCNAICGTAQVDSDE